MTDFEKLSVFHLATGSHKSQKKGLCAMEAVAWLEGLAHSDHPECTCPVIAAYVRRLNDSLGDDERQRLVAYLPRLVGTVSKEHEQARYRYLRRAAAYAYAAAVAAAADAADAADARRARARQPVDAAFIALDGVLAIGPSGRPFARPASERVAAYRELIKA